MLLKSNKWSADWFYSYRKAKHLLKYGYWKPLHLNYEIY